MGSSATTPVLSTKSGAFAAGDPLADFWRSWFADPVLRLPEGRYVITAYAHHGGRGPVCHQGPWETLTASVAIEVLPRPASSPDPSPAASPSPGTSATPAAVLAAE